ncbi:MAG: D-sedoheptulose 7-phosphate isomerase, partial [Candidatus Omnitrophica bacterium]|nr:D-sedoheptulose 7-phosphate isomerase [Candidatus Omnitrophota bacterium]
MKSMRGLIKKRIEESIKVKKDLCESQANNIEKAVRMVTGSLKKGGKVLAFGNGGSAADSQHIVAELIGRFKKERRPIAGIALTANTSTITALANDYGYDATFARQIEALGKPKDVAIGISTSGRSKNVIAAMRKAKELGLVTIGLTGGDGGSLKRESDIAIVVNSSDTARIQESHI